MNVTQITVLSNCVQWKCGTTSFLGDNIPLLWDRPQAVPPSKPGRRGGIICQSENEDTVEGLEMWSISAAFENAYASIPQLHDTRPLSFHLYSSEVIEDIH